MTSPQFYNALPAFPGGKRQLLPHIRRTLETAVPMTQWEQLRFFDAFCGAGSVSLWAKLQGFKELHSNDISRRSQLVLRGLIQNQYTRLDWESVRPVFEWTAVEDTCGFIQTIHGQSVFAAPHSRALDAVRDWMYSTNDPTTQALRGLVLWKLTQKAVAYGTSIGTSNRHCAQVIDSRQYHLLSPKRLKDGSFQRQCEPLLTALPQILDGINKGVFPALGQVSVYQADILELLPKISSDIAYFDPPYAQTTGYDKTFSVLDSVLFGPSTVGNPNTVFSQSTEVLSTMLDLASHIPIWVISYNDKVLGLDEFIALVQRVAPQRKVMGQAIPYKHMSHVAKRENQELLLVAY